MRNKVFYKSAKKFLDKNPRGHRFVTYNKAQSILLLFNSGGRDDMPVRGIIEELEKDNKSVAAWGFCKTKELPAERHPSIKLFDKKNVNLFYKPDESIIKEAASVRYDLLIDLSLHDSLPLMYLALYADARMKAGTRITGFQLYDFIIDIKKNADAASETRTDEQFLFKEITFYLKSIQTTD